MAGDFQVQGTNAGAPFSLKLHRGDGMCLLAMNWRNGRPPPDFVGFCIEYREPGGGQFYALNNRICFPGVSGTKSTRESPIQKFRWVHFPRNAELPGAFRYRVTPVFMDAADKLSYGAAQEADIELARETYPGALNVTFTRGFVSSQAFVDRYGGAQAIPQLLPKKADDGLGFQPTHPKAKEALAWMGFEARHAILEVLDQALADPTAEVRVVAYDLCEPDVVGRLEKLGPRLRIIIDDSGGHGKAHSAESQAAARLVASAGASNVQRHHMGGLQHNKTIVVDGAVKAAVCGSTNFTWRGFFVQANNAVVVRGASAIKPFMDAFDAYWKNGTPALFGRTGAAKWVPLGLPGIDARVGFSPYAKKNSVLAAVGKDLGKARSSLFYSLAFLYQTPGAIKAAIKKLTADPKKFVYGMSDRRVGGITLQKPDGNLAPVRPEALTKGVPQPFKAEPTGGAGNRMHHKFLVIDFDRPEARVYLGSYNFSAAADGSNGENLLLIRDRRIATSYMVEAVRLFDHYHFRVKQIEAKKKHDRLELRKPPRKKGERAWWEEDYTDPRKIRDRELFS